MKKLTKNQIYNKLYNGSLADIDKNLSVFIKHKTLISKNNKLDPPEFKY